MTGIVHLVGAGPGDPGLLTVRAATLLRVAEVVAYDELVSAPILALASTQAERIPVGHRAGDGARSFGIHPIVIERARAGRRVVRLKGGDPLIFGRVGEEIEELEAAGVPFEIVPGISAAQGAAAALGIPLTQRQLASDVTFVSGHDVNGSCEGRTNWQSLGSATGTIVLYMASRALGPNLERLVRAGRAPVTPALYISDATTGEQRVIKATLADLAGKVGTLGRTALVIVGDVIEKRRGPT